MKVNGKTYRSVWMQGNTLRMIDQTYLPFEFKIFESKDYHEICAAIKDMLVRGAGAIGAAAGYAMALAAHAAPEYAYESFIAEARKEIEATRPTARNLFYTTEKVYHAAKESRTAAMKMAEELADENAEEGRLIGVHGNQLIEKGMRIETHCNAGWLAFVDYGSALAPIYCAHDAGKNVFVYADETRPRSQGGRLTAWELHNHGVPHAIIPDNAGAALMAAGKVDMCIVGADRVAANGDVANKIGTLEKAIAAHYYSIPFYVAAPLSTIDPDTASGKDIIIENRNKAEVLMQSGRDANGDPHHIFVNHPASEALNPAFDVTPAGLITGIITDKGIVTPSLQDIKKLFES